MNLYTTIIKFLYSSLILTCIISAGCAKNTQESSTRAELDTIKTKNDADLKSEESAKKLANESGSPFESGKEALKKLDVKETLNKDFNVNPAVLSTFSGGWDYTKDDAFVIDLKANKAALKASINSLERDLIRLRNIEEFVQHAKDKMLVLSEEVISQNKIEAENTNYKQIVMSVGLISGELGERAYTEINNNLEKEQEIMEQLYGQRQFIEREYWFKLSAASDLKNTTNSSINNKSINQKPTQITKINNKTSNKTKKAITKKKQNAKPKKSAKK